MIDSTTRGFWSLFLGLGTILAGALLQAGASIMETTSDGDRFGQTAMSWSGIGLVLAGAITVALALAALLAFREDA